MVIHFTLLKVKVKKLKRNQSVCSSFDKALADLFLNRIANQTAVS